MLPVMAIGEVLLGLLRGPLGSILESYVSDQDLKRKLAAEIEQAVIAAAARSAELGAGIVSEETRSEHFVTWAWRPLLMVLLMGFLVLTGMVLPIADMIVGHPLRYQPRWAALPPGFWDFLSIGMGGYIGGRTIEKVAGQVLGGPRRGRGK